MVFRLLAKKKFGVWSVAARQKHCLQVAAKKKRGHWSVAA
jgi:hypothetical protein